MIRTKFLRSLALTLVVLLLSANYTVALADLRVGDSGSLVREVQSRLKKWGYYSGAVDGVFGSGTQDAVKAFQRKYGLTADGIIGEATARKIGITLTGTSGGSTGSSGDFSSGDVYLLAKVVHGEARGEPYVGKVGVAAVVLNRIESSHFPNTIAGVVYQPGAFTAVSDGQINLAPDEESLRAARDAINGWDPTGNAIYYYNPAVATSSWIYSRTVVAVIGRHRFAI
ncbi:MAG: spore cortex-lytic enzyme [Eubacteriales bacterium]|nr:spore cortex-lytic enzyme [Eubacteriales bacterium]